MQQINVGDRVTFQSYNGLKLVNGRAVPEFTPWQTSASLLKQWHAMGERTSHS